MSAPIVQQGDSIVSSGGTAFRVLTVWRDGKGRTVGVAASESGRRRAFSAEDLVQVSRGSEGARSWRVVSR